MALVVLQPAGNKDARKHYADTIQSPVRFSDFVDCLEPADVRRLTELFPTGLAPMWGVTPGTNGVNHNKFAKADLGSVVLFATAGRLFAAGVIALKFSNRTLARRLWGENDTGMTWEHMYALDQLVSLDISYAQFNSVVGYKSNNIIQGFNVLDRDKSERVLDHFGLWSGRHAIDVSTNDVEDALTGLDGDLDRQVRSWARVEQSRAKSLLLAGRSSGVCRLCSREFPGELLIAAHKKRRSLCTDAEKRDLANNMMLCCTFGCDALYERGYVFIGAQGEIKKSKVIQIFGAADAYIRDVMVRSLRMSEHESKYFAWHRERFSQENL